MGSLSSSCQRSSPQHIFCCSNDAYSPRVFERKIFFYNRRLQSPNRMQAYFQSVLQRSIYGEAMLRQFSVLRQVIYGVLANPDVYCAYTCMCACTKVGRNIYRYVQERKGDSQFSRLGMLVTCVGQSVLACRHHTPRVKAPQWSTSLSVGSALGQLKVISIDPCKPSI